MMNNETNVRKDILVTANQCVNGEREGTYGNPENNFGTIASFWTAYLRASGARSDVTITATDVAAMMALMKVARIGSGNFKLDNWIDLAGYAACGGEIQANANKK